MLRTLTVIFFLALTLLDLQPSLARGRAAKKSQPSGPSATFTRSHSATLQSERVDALRTQAIEKYTKLGSQLESEKKWVDAEKVFRYVLHVIALRDGPGSPNSLPVLEHLVTITKAQNKVDDEIGFQSTVLRMKEAQTKPDREAILNAQLDLADLFIKKQDWRSARSSLKEAMAIYNAQPSLLPQKRQETYQQYANVLRQLHKDSEAEEIEAAAKNSSTPSLPSKTP